MKKKLINFAIKYLKTLLRVLQWTVIVFVWLIWITLFVAMFLIPYWIIIFPLIILFVKIYIKIVHLNLQKYAYQNVIVHGGRGKGKGLIFQYLIMKEQEVLSNMPYGDNSVIVDPKKYFGSITPNTSENFLKNEITKCDKHLEWEGKPYYVDDTALYFPNYNDPILKKLYPQISLFIPIQRHLYDSYTVINAQDINRVYKILRELQTDGYIKALSTTGKGFIWNRLPVLRKYYFVKWRYHEKLESAVNNILPFEKLGLINRGSELLYTTTASAMKEQYVGVHGEIKDGFLWLKKKHISYNTRYFHDVFFKENLIK